MLPSVVSRVLIAAVVVEQHCNKCSLVAGTILAVGVPVAVLWDCSLGILGNLVEKSDRLDQEHN